MIADYPDKNRRIDGGVQAVTKYLVDAMAQMSDIELHVISFKAGTHSVVIERDTGFVRYSIPFGRFGAITGFKEDQARLDALLAEIEPDIVHSQGGGHQGLLAKRTSYPTVITIHGILAQEIRFLPKISQRARTRMQVWLGERHYIRQATHTILISQYVADFYGPTLSGNRYLIPNPIDERFFKVERHEKAGRILFLGRLCERKGVKELLRAVSRIKKIEGLRVILAGSLADKKYVDELKVIVDSSALTRIVEFRGLLGFADIIGELSQCSCLVLPSFQETAPMVIQEAMACGVPVIASDVCGIPYQVDDGESGFLVPAGRVDELSERLTEVLCNFTLRESFSKAAQIKAENQYRSTVVARETVNVYEDMLK